MESEQFFMLGSLTGVPAGTNRQVAFQFLAKIVNLSCILAQPLLPENGSARSLPLFGDLHCR
jgi:hypothetical protein